MAMANGSAVLTAITPSGATFPSPASTGHLMTLTNSSSSRMNELAVCGFVGCSRYIWVLLRFTEQSLHSLQPKVCCSFMPLKFPSLLHAHSVFVYNATQEPPEAELHITMKSIICNSMWSTGADTLPKAPTDPLTFNSAHRTQSALHKCLSLISLLLECETLRSASHRYTGSSEWTHASIQVT